jgi:hypothetical protein
MDTFEQLMEEVNAGREEMVWDEMFDGQFADGFFAQIDGELGYEHNMQRLQFFKNITGKVYDLWDGQTVFNF